MHSVFRGIPSHVRVRVFENFPLNGLSVHVIATLTVPSIYTASVLAKIPSILWIGRIAARVLTTERTSVSVRTRRRAISVPRCVLPSRAPGTRFDNSPLRATGVALGAKAWAMAATRATRRTVSRAIFFSMSLPLRRLNERVEGGWVETGDSAICPWRDRIGSERSASRQSTSHALLFAWDTYIRDFPFGYVRRINWVCSR